MPITINGNGTITGLNDIDIVSASATNTPLIVQGANSQTADLFDIKNNAGIDLFSINSSGLIGGSGTSMVWTNFTPSIVGATTSPTLGTGSETTGAYIQIGKLVIYRFKIIFGTSGVAAGSGEYRILCPVAAAGTGEYGAAFQIFLYDSSTAAAWSTGSPHFITTTTFSISYGVGGGNTSVSNAAPWVWAASDQIKGGIVYQAA